MPDGNAMTDRDLRDDWLHIIAHDLKTPIGSVMGSLDLIRELGPLNERQLHFAERAMVGLQRMEDLIAHMLDIAWINGEMDLYPVQFDMAALVYETLAILEDKAQERGITIEVEVADDLVLVLGDKGRLAQVVQNLLSNAIKYNRDNGWIHVTIENRGDLIQVTVQDSGVGISPQELPRIFDQFYRTDDDDKRKIKGSGLGLAITKAIVERHHGYIQVESTPNEGTVFRFAVPRRFEGGDGNDRGRELHPSKSLPERYDMMDRYDPEGPGEEMDAVDDNEQEGYDAIDSDSERGDRPDDFTSQA